MSPDAKAALKPLGHDLNPDNDDDMDWLIAWSKAAESKVRALEAKRDALMARVATAERIIRIAGKATAGRMSNERLSPARLDAMDEFVREATKWILSSDSEEASQ